MIIIDPARYGCTVRYKDNVQFLNGDPLEICDRIKKFVMYKDEETGKEIQKIDILLDTIGVGTLYADWFKYNSISYTRVKPKQFIK